MKSTGLLVVAIAGVLVGCTPRPDENHCAFKPWPQTGWRDEFLPDAESMDSSVEISKAYEAEQALKKQQEPEEAEKSAAVKAAEKGL